MPLIGVIPTAGKCLLTVFRAFLKQIDAWFEHNDSLLHHPDMLAVREHCDVVHLARLLACRTEISD